MEEPLLHFIPPADRAEPDFFTKYRYPVFALLALGLSLGIYLTLTPPPNPLGDNAMAVDESPDAQVELATSTTQKIVIDIAGGILNPGVYRLDAGAIVEDAIEIGGGLSNRADMTEIAHSINRAALVENHSKIYIPQVGDNKIVYLNPSSTSTGSSSSSLKSTNLNTATNAELEALPGIGEVLAQRIIDYRLTSGKFTNVDDLKNVPGIGDKLFAQIQDLVKV